LKFLDHFLSPIRDMFCLALEKKQQYCIWRVACVNWGFNSCKY